MAFPVPTSPHIRDAGGTALWACLDGDGIGIDNSLRPLNVVDLMELKDGLQYLLETVENAMQTRGL